MQPAEVDANCRLIASAPALLEALERAADELEHSGLHHEHPSIRHARAAIRSAKGEGK